MPPENPSPVAGSAPDPGRLPVALAVDDDPAIRGFLAAALQERCRVVPAGSGEEALAAAEREEPDLVLLDLGLPGINGLEVLRRLRAAHPSAAVVVITGRGSEEAAAASMREGAADFLVKPFDVARILDAADHALARRALRIARGREEERLRRERGELTEARATLEELVRARTRELEEANRAFAAVNLRLQERNRGLAELERGYEELFELAADGLLKTDEAGRIHLANRRAQILAGASLVDLRGRDAAELIGAESREEFRRGLRAVAAGEAEGFGMEAELDASPGPPIPVAVRISPLVREGRVRSLELALEDISQRRRDEARLRALEERAIVAGMSRHLSHVLLNALTGAGGRLARVAREPALSAAAREQLEVAGAEIAKMEEAVAAYQDYVATTKARPSVRCECPDLLRGLAGGRAVTVPGNATRIAVLDVAPGPAPVLVDPPLFRLGLDYLLRGIAHAHAAAGLPEAALEVRAAREGSEYRIRILSRGVRFAEGILQTIDRPWRHQVLHRTFDRWDLAIAETMAERHGGRLTVQSLEDGTEFLLRLPCAAP